MIYSHTRERKVDFTVSKEHETTPLLRPEEEDLQEAYENNHYYKSLDPEDFSTDRGWWFDCRICGGQTKLRSRHPYCRHCGFSQRSMEQRRVA